MQDKLYKSSSFLQTCRNLRVFVSQNLDIFTCDCSDENIKCRRSCLLVKRMKYLDKGTERRGGGTCAGR